MGQLFGARLIAAGNDVIFTDVSQFTIHALNEQGITVQSEDTQIEVSATAGLAADFTQPVDLVMVFTKGFHTAAAVDSVKHLFHDGTLGLSLQNGLGNEKPLLEELGTERTLVGITDFPADRVGSTFIASAGSGRVVLGDAFPTGQVSTAAKAIAEAFDAAGLNAVPHPNVQIPVWEKLIFNTVLNTIGGATGLTVGKTGRVDSARRLAEAVLEEAFAVVRACGIDVSENSIRSSIESAIVSHAEHKTSMTVDVETNIRTEIDTIGGAVESAGREAGISTPILSTLCEVVRLRTLEELQPV